MLTTNIKLAEKYDYLNENFKAAFEFLKRDDLSEIPVGVVQIKREEVFAQFQEYSTIPSEEAMFEAHDKFFDIQYVIDGTEKFGYIPRECLEVKIPYNSEKDIVFFNEPEECGEIVLNPGEFAIVPPEDAHKPRCINNNVCKVKKIVIKVRV